MNPRLRHIRHVALDLDGTIYNGGTVFSETNPFLKVLDQLGLGHTFLTNNSSKSVRDYLVQLKRMGIVCSAADLYSSTQATIEYLRTKLPLVRRLFVLGTPSLREHLAAIGFTMARDDSSDEPDGVLVGFDTTLNFARLCRAAYWIKQGKPFIATHADRVCPTDQPTVLVDCGSICAALEKATDRSPDAVMGKPDPGMLRGILAAHNLMPRQLLVVGDRLYTDILMARKAGAIGALVLTGETTLDDVSKAKPKPDLVVRNLKELGELLKMKNNRR